MNRSVSGDRALLTGILGAALISTSAVLVKLADLPATTTAALRTGYAVPVLALLAVIAWRRRPLPRDPRQRAWCLVAGVLFAGATLMQNLAVALIGAGIATVICNLQVLVVAVGAWWCFAERPPRRLLLALPPALLGVVMVSGMLGGQATGTDPSLGVLAGLANSLCYGAFLMVMRHAQRFGAAQPVAALRDVTAVAFAVSLLTVLAAGDGGMAPSWPAHGWMLLLALGPQVFGWLLITTNLPRLPLAVSGLLLLLQPMLTMGLAMVLLGENPSIVQLIGCVLLMTAVGFGAGTIVLPRPKGRQWLKSPSTSPRTRRFATTSSPGSPGSRRPPN
ncbi:DMT family transporter [Stackebrandtia nassauensis]|uniref:EamA domain-containing protein n=1 Tax=Stackebrandtia nassauensis (strain DSM 44728 / CIP 108903 / NRRL B-16338 / NBRC 102104 / LLR-40K-21) TaxID=446470 RepID=D3PVR6_STANL|nr:DMT family transporter [Stackebrandtia nassauensis]ADD43180.1 protein of unknown function DUF6 transmembrane [Stackebrandtia nassauensis DSM 44728]